MKGGYNETVKDFNHFRSFIDPGRNVRVGGAKVRQQTTTTTLGQELKDLDDAYKKGLLNEKEYKKVRKELIEKYTD